MIGRTLMMIDKLGDLDKIEYWNYCYFDFTFDGEFCYLRVHTEKGRVLFVSDGERGGFFFAIPELFSL